MAAALPHGMPASTTPAEQQVAKKELRAIENAEKQNTFVNDKRLRRPVGRKFNVVVHKGGEL
ncbi:hypothetical protein GGH95_003681 [Coemansia sp. RSA 1836]|nr:hypothetical protein GGH95_003681 [Coemansia sp. RSA 1836]